MVEFGSDFHLCESCFRSESPFFTNISDDVRYYANGRLAIAELIAHEGWTRIWIPAYFCYEVIEHIKSTGIQIEFYDDYPLVNNDEDIIRGLPFEQGDSLLRINYFGLRSIRSNSGIPVPIIEDHTHALSSDWALNSNADWCIASIRKTLPTPAGGVLWSPKHNKLPEQLKTSVECEKMSEIRYDAMKKKSRYLESGGDKGEFRQKYIQSEQMMDSLVRSGMDNHSFIISSGLDVYRWADQKSKNWKDAVSMLHPDSTILKPSQTQYLTPYSIVIYCDSVKERSVLRQHLIDNNVYPAILWQMPDDCEFQSALDFSQRMLSVHCDARYDHNDIVQLCRIINSYYDKHY